MGGQLQFFWVAKLDLLKWSLFHRCTEMGSCVTIGFASFEEIRLLQQKLMADPDKSIGSVTWQSGPNDSLGENVFIIHSDREIAGFCTYRAVPAEIFPLVVFSPFRRKGVGREAMKQFISLLKKEGVEEIMIDIVDGAESFWQSVFTGFAVRHHCDRKYFVALSSLI